MPTKKLLNVRTHSEHLEKGLGNDRNGAPRWSGEKNYQSGFEDVMGPTIECIAQKPR